MARLEFKKWAESIFGRGIMDDPEPASQIPLWLNKMQNGAFPQYDLEPLPGNKKPMKKMKKKP